MTKKITIPTLLVVLATLITSSCDTEGSCYYSTEVGVINSTFPDSAKVDSATLLSITYLPFSNCAKLKELRPISSGDTILIRVYADSDECTCVGSPDSVALFYFTPKAEREYIFRFIHPADSIIQDTLKAYL